MLFSGDFVNKDFYVLMLYQTGEALVGQQICDTLMFVKSFFSLKPE